MSTPKTMSAFSKHNAPGPAYQNAMIAFLAVLFFVGLMPRNVYGQFLNLQLIVQNEVNVSDSRNLDMGFIPVNYGWVQVGLSDDYSGRFTIGASENVNLLVTVDAPDELVMDESNRMPFLLEVAYLNNSSRRVHRAKPFIDGRAFFPINDNGKLAENMNRIREPLEASIFFYGSAYAGRVAPGIYRATITITTEFE